jgi:hypothetical protein
MLALRSLVYTIIIPGTVTVLIPYLILSGRGERIAQPWRVLQVLAGGHGGRRHNTAALHLGVHGERARHTGADRPAEGAGCTLGAEETG